MTFKRMSAASLAVCLAAALALPVLAAEEADVPTEVDVPVPARYAAAITFNGEALDSVTYTLEDPDTYEETEVTVSLADLPGAPGGYVPMRVLCAADPDGYVSWIESENSAVFSFHKNSFIVYFDDLSIEVQGEKVEGVSAYLYHDGVTFIPVSFLATLPGVEVDFHPEMDSERYDFTLVVSPLEALAQTIKSETGCAANLEMAVEDLEMAYNVPAGVVEEAVAYAPFMVNPDTLFIAKAPVDQHDAIQEAFEACRQQKVETFTWYLPDQLPKAESGKVVSQGEYVMLYIGEKPDKAVELFTAGVAEL